MSQFVISLEGEHSRNITSVIAAADKLFSGTASDLKFLFPFSSLLVALVLFVVCVFYIMGCLVCQRLI